jgi:hypothetical protein
MKALGRVFLSLLSFLLAVSALLAFATGNQVNGLLLMGLALTIDNRIQMSYLKEALEGKNEGCGCKINKGC